MHLSHFSRWTQFWMVRGAHETRDLTGSKRRISGVLCPPNKEAIAEIVRQACRSRGIQLQPISCGRNWGFGSALPDQDDVYLLDLSLLNSIQNLDLTEHRVTLEPGVTQGQLDKALELSGRSHTFNVTGAGATASVLGNALERGIGYVQQRDLDILELELITGNGDILKTSRFDSRLAGRHRSGLGPDPLGLFTQSSFGIVTGATLALKRRPEQMSSLSLAMRDADCLPEFFTVLSDILAEGWLHCVPHVFNDTRFTTSLEPFLGPANTPQFSPWSAMIPIAAPSAVARGMAQELERRLSPLGKVTSALLSCPVDQTQPASQHPVTAMPPYLLAELGKLSQGIPSNIAMPGVAWAALQKRVADDSDPETASTAGLIHVTPTCPLAGGAPTELLSIIERVRSTHRWRTLPMTFNVMSCRLAALIISIPFDRAQPDEAARCRDFASELLEACCFAGFAPYRLGIEPKAASLPSAAAPWRNLFSAIQQQLDPYSVLASGKYHHLWENRVVSC